jgi:carboxyl-terminal processing protease
MKKQAVRVLCLICALVFVMMLSGFAEEEDRESQATDFSTSTWTEAFDLLHERLSTEYAFTDWKGIDWGALGSACRAEIQVAQDQEEFEGYYLALRRYINAIPDGHVGMGSLAEIDQKYVSGGFGFTPVLLEGGAVVASWVDEASEAYRAGLRAGDELLTWNGMPIAEAAMRTPTFFASNAATEEDAALKRMAYLARAAVGNKAELTFRNDTGETCFAGLTAYDDGMITIKKSYPVAVVSDKFRETILGVESGTPPLTSMVDFEILDGNIAYIRIWGELDADLTGSGNAPSTLALFQSAVKSANDAGCEGLILDIRNNVGGLDDMAAAMLGSFYGERTFYEYQNDYDSATGTRVIQRAMIDSEALMIEPAEALFTGRVIALVNQKCVSSGEGLALGIRNLPNGETLGFYGTNGSFGMTGGEALMPGGLAIRWPAGQSLDENRQIQIDSRGGIGGVAPTLRIPMTRERALWVAEGEDVELAEALALLCGER